jgi:hypothetical protein
MTLKNAAVLAFIGMTLLSVLQAVVFVRNLVALGNGVIPVLTVVSSLVHAFAAVSLAMFFYSFQRAQG